MATNSIAHGAVTFSANTEPLIRGFQEASKQTKAFAKKLNEDAKQASRGKTGGGLGADLGKDFAQELGRRTFAGGVLGGIASGGIMGGFSELVANSSAAMFELASNTGKWAREMEKGSTISAELGKSIGRFFDTGGMTVTRAEKELSGFRRMAEQTRKEIEELRDIGSKEGWQLWGGGGFETKMKELQRDLQGSEAAASKLMDTLAKLRANELMKKNEKILPFTERKEATDYLKFLDEVKERQRFAGMEPEQIRLEKLRDKTPEHLMKNLEMEMEMARVIEERMKQAKKEAGFGLVAEAMKDAGMQFDIGAFSRPAPKPPKLLADAVEAGTKEAYSLSMRNQLGETGGPARAQEKNLQKLDEVKSAIDKLNADLSGILGKLGIV